VRTCNPLEHIQSPMTYNSLG